MGSRTVSEDPDEPEEPFHIRDRISHDVNPQLRRDRDQNEQRTREGPPRREVFRIGRRTIPAEEITPQSMSIHLDGVASEIELPVLDKGSESAADDAPSSRSKDSSSKDAHKESSVNSN